MKTPSIFILPAIIFLMLVKQNLFAQTSWELTGNTATDPGTNFLGTTDNAAFVIRTKNIERLRIKSNGKIGIGTTNPISPLHVKGTDSLIASFDGGTITYTGFYENGSFRGYIGSLSGAAEDVDFGTAIGNGTGKLHLAIQSVPKLTINTAGDVGIGTTSPLAKLQVTGGSNVTPTGGGTIVIGPTTDFNLAIDNNEIMARSNGAAAPLLLNKDGGDVNISSGGLFFQGATERLGIGTFVPDVKLHVTGGTNASLSGGGSIVAGPLTASTLVIDNNEIMARNNGAAGTLFLNDDGGDVSIGENGFFWKSSNSHVGIGTTTPEVKLQVVGGTDLSLSGGGTIVAGPLTGNNLALDNTEIQARNNGVADTLSLNAEGGLVQTGGDLYIKGGDLFLNNSTSLTGGNFRIIADGSFVPSFDDGWELGTPSVRWMDIWAADGTINTSDARDKKNIRALDYGLKEIMRLRPVKFNWKNEDKPDDKLGLIAQDLQKVLPEVVRDFEYATNLQTGKKEKMPATHLGVMYADIIPVLIKAMQEQQVKINSQDKKIEALTKRLDQLTESLLKNDLVIPGDNKIIDLDVNAALLGQNAPNPFNQRTVINYFVPQNAGKAFIKITDVQGRLIKTIAVIAKGKDQLILQTGQLTSGTYYYSLIVNGKQVGTKEMILSK